MGERIYAWWEDKKKREPGGEGGRPWRGESTPGPLHCRVRARGACRRSLAA